ncbi:MAG: hypothetical protein GY679_01915 [Mycoplasma sp.]|nr:hypothetical protein [Mycoplasma sp.]
MKESKLEIKECEDEQNTIKRKHKELKYDVDNYFFTTEEWEEDPYSFAWLEGSLAGQEVILEINSEIENNETLKSTEQDIKNGYIKKEIANEHTLGKINSLKKGLDLLECVLLRKMARIKKEW